ncbi:MAG: transcriptional repressor LexA [Clostridiales bacterium]|nr:transcriptional repressor LexA [Clostridiales bacterium]
MRETTKDKIQLVLAYVNEYVMQNGYPPSVREICAALQFKSTSTVHSYLKCLEADGRIKKSPSKPRALKVLGESANGAQRLFSTYGSAPSGDDAVVEVPVVGTVTAGKPILAVENVEYTFPVPAFFTRNATAFMLRVEGDSMINAGIFHRDYLLVRQQPTAQNGDIVVAMIGDEATVKTFYKEKSRIRLQPENDHYSPIYASGDCTIIGKAIGVFRKL